MVDTGPLAAAVRATGRTPEELATASGIPAPYWKALATRRPLHPTGRPWRPGPQIIEGIAAGIGITGNQVKDLIRAGW